jgi:hypothetical protein
MMAMSGSCCEGCGGALFEVSANEGDSGGGFPGGTNSSPGTMAKI